MNSTDLNDFLTRLRSRYHSPNYLWPDPLGFPRRYADRRDREIVALVSAVLAYGNVKQILASVDKLLALMGPHPAQYVAGFNPEIELPRLKSFKHRWTDGRDMAGLFWLIRQALRDGTQTLEDFFVQTYNASEPDLVGSSERFVARFYAQDMSVFPCGWRLPERQKFRSMLPSPVGGSACKRLNLFLRWMVRPDDGLDLGLWSGVSPRQLIIPLDTHVGRISRHLGLTDKKHLVLRTALEITGALRKFEPDDPVSFDFAISRLGILKQCPTHEHLDYCMSCELAPVCRRREALLRESAETAAVACAAEKD
ncbi:MAG: TIGR02757 family protein [bacterium]